MIDGVEAPVLHIPPLLPESTTMPPKQNVVLPLADITDAVGTDPMNTELLSKETAPAVERALP